MLDKRAVISNYVKNGPYLSCSNMFFLLNYNVLIFSKIMATNSTFPHSYVYEVLFLRSCRYRSSPLMKDKKNSLKKPIIFAFLIFLDTFGWPGWPEKQVFSLFHLPRDEVN